MVADVAQYTLEIATEIGDAEKSSAELDALTGELSRSGINAEHFEHALLTVNKQLSGAVRVSGAANAALAIGTAEYRSLEKAARMSAKAAEVAGRKHKGVIPEEHAAKVREADAAVNAYAGTLRKLEDDASGAAVDVERFGHTLKNVDKLQRRVNDRLGDAATNMAAYRGALGDIGGPLGEFGERLILPVQAFVDLNEKFGRSKALMTLLVVGVVAVVAVLALLTAATVFAAVSLAALGVRLADSARSAGLATEAFAAMHPEIAGVSQDIEGLAKSTRVGEEDLRGLAVSLREAGVSAGELPAALRAAALAESALGKGGASDLVADLKAGKTSVDEFANTAEQKFGGIVARQMLGLDVQGATLKRNLAGLFGGLEIEPLLKSLSKLIGMFDETSAVGGAIKEIFEAVFQPLIDNAETARLAIEAFALGFLIGIVKMYIAAKPAIKAITEFFGFEDPTLAETLDFAKTAGEYLAKGIGVLVLVFGGLLAIQLAVWYGLYKVAEGVIWLGAKAWELSKIVGSALVDGVSAAFDFLVGSAGMFVDMVGQAISDVFGSFAKLGELPAIALGVGKDIVLGLARGISNAAGAVLSAMLGVVKGAYGAAKSFLGINSPSSLMDHDIGQQTGEGAAQGIERKIPRVRAAMAKMVEPPAAPVLSLPELPVPRLAAGPSGRDGTSPSPPVAPASGGKSLDLSGASFVFNGVADAETASQRFGEMLTRFLEGDAASAAGEVAPA
jgi:hypothetical protein